MAASRQDLIGAIKDGDVGQVRQVLTSTDLMGDESDLKGYLLLVAIEEDQEEIVRLLCRKGWTNVVRSDDLSLIHVAAKYGNVNIIETLLRNGAGVNDQSSEHRLTPLLMAVRWGQRDAVLHLLDSGANANLTSGRYKQVTSPLHEAVDAGGEDVVNLLLAGRADVNQVNGRRQLPLHLACTTARADGPCRQRLVKRLLACGSLVNAVDTDCNTPLHPAVTLATQSGNNEILRMLCVAGAHIGAFNDAGETPLHMVAAQSQRLLPSQVGRSVDAAKLLLHFGADVNRENSRGHIPLQTALLSGCVLPLVHLLVESGTDVNHCDDRGETILHSCAKTWGTVNGVRYLLRHGAHYDTVSDKLLSPLSSACLANYCPNIGLLCQEAPGLLRPAARIPKVTGRPLHCAARTQGAAGLSYLLQAGYKWERGEVVQLLEWPGLPQDVLDLLQGLLERPPVVTLGALCRDVLRAHLEEQVRSKVEQLPLPQRLKDQLLLRDIEPLGPTDSR